MFYFTVKSKVYTDIYCVFIVIQFDYNVILNSTYFFEYVLGICYVNFEELLFVITE